MANTNNRIIFSVIFLILMCSAQTYAQTPVSLQDLFEKGQSIGKSFRTYEDAEKTMSIENIIGSNAILWRESDVSVLNYSFSKSA